MYLLADVSETPGQQQLDLRMDVLDSVLQHETPGLDLRKYLPEAFGQHFQFVGREQSDGLQHADMGHGACHVILGEPQVQSPVVAYRKFLHDLGRGFSLIPQCFCHMRSFL